MKNEKYFSPLFGTINFSVYQIDVNRVHKMVFKLIIDVKGKGLKKKYDLCHNSVGSPPPTQVGNLLLIFY